MKFNLEVPNNVETIFKIAVHYLIELFDYSEQQGIDAVEQYHLEWQSTDLEVDYYFGLGPFEVAIRTHYFTTLNGNESDYIFWRRDNDFNKSRPVPKDAEILWKNFVSGR